VQRSWSGVRVAFHARKCGAHESRAEASARAGAAALIAFLLTLDAGEVID